MSDSRTVEIFSADCPLCDDVVDRIREMTCSSCDVQVVSLREEEGTRRAEALGVQSVPAVAVDGTLAACCQEQGIDEAALRAAGIGEPQ